jgi:DNA replication protein DnaC
MEQKKINCDVHGVDADGLFNGKCELCFKEEVQKIAGEMAEKLFEQRQKASNIPLRYKKATLDNYIVNKQSLELVDKLKSYDYKSNIVLTGKTGTGKTHLACGLINKSLRADKTSFYAPYYLLNDIKKNDKNLFQYAMECDILVIDEYGSHPSEWNSQLLTEIVTDRYNNCVHIFLISNLYIENFSNSISEAAYSKLSENMIIKNCCWGDFRFNEKKD